MSTATSIQQMFKEVETAGRSFFAGDPAPILALWSHAEDVTVFGGAGSYAQGWSAVRPRLEWAAAHFRGGQGTLEPVAIGESRDLAYTIHLERGDTQGQSSDQSIPVALRVTQLYRREDGTWKIFHRHADALTERNEAAAFNTGQQ